MTFEIPNWALHYLGSELPAGVEYVNAVTLEKGRYKGSVLVNTNRGALLLTKSSVGEPVARFLPLPGTVVSFRCEACQQANESHNPPIPADVHCGRCGVRHRIVSPTEIRRVAQATTRSKGE